MLLLYGRQLVLLLGGMLLQFLQLLFELILSSLSDEIGRARLVFCVNLLRGHQLLLQLIILLGRLVHFGLCSRQNTQHLLRLQFFHFPESPQQGLVLEDQRPQLTIILQDLENFHEFSIVLGSVDKLRQNHFLFLGAELAVVAGCSLWTLVTGAFVGFTTTRRKHTALKLCLSLRLALSNGWQLTSSGTLVIFLIVIFVIVVLVVVWTGTILNSFDALMLLLLVGLLSDHTLNSHGLGRVAARCRRLYRSLARKEIVHHIVLIWREWRVHAAGSRRVSRPHISTVVLGISALHIQIYF